MPPGSNLNTMPLPGYTPAMNYTKMEKIRRAKLGI